MAKYTELDINSQGVATLTLNRPDVHNAFDDVMIAELLKALKEVEESDSARVLVLRSEGKNFSAGADLNWMRSMADKNYQQNVDDAGELGLLMERLDLLSKPSIALVQGAAFGGAVGLAACCDIVLAQPRSSFCLSEVKIGLIPAVISPYVVRTIGERQSRRYMLTAERFFADKAQELGLVNDVVEDFDEPLNKLLEALLANSPQAVGACKKLIRNVGSRPIDKDVREHTIKAIAEIRVSDEGQEGLSAFLEKRPAAWLKQS
ncbi:MULTISPECIES: enoyl-CoA hydratase/isomerase family protein [Idiomarina]|jgi:methylglutaconyl-CoA hydratase|uniref:Enoyl-CoA hydratase/isomerase family protein n=1 Tax=Idiomarina abyssalis TaxID=86102 RepID=A0A8I1GB45_9GAMM|nr:MULTISPECIES: enoyl-CoA hydratase/isomerase family protein [Idiomarina]MBF79714.1 gamma-carboxygeranoyl-CoA hydratase [Idiomarina sp.]MBJ7267614.1 enoyl-CoA hydratase/isomerase family protein [Idiomarina abyssalis]MBJ7272909.1 enoyl-CoA hydratase/isomerase family protein [Idiomarina abyssalis]MBJ7315432.1 enoyl-CoA hydratase/isomerase family protein [Idiomarina abyssalis]MBP57938.1 gamma-carboxygeranoyl-CoA hydratase [Idiomarina sp.]|tara:strand:- start:525 stop:1310 length:786 start_codon:yes stop_codon:yes gene_type:complete